MSACIDTPISWLRLEQHALAADAEVARHLEACRACRACMDEIAPMELPALPRAIGSAPKKTPAPQPSSRMRLIAPAFALAAAAVVLLIVVSRRPHDDEERGDRFAVKGGELVIGLVRERAGTITEDALTNHTGDRWKVVVTCPPAGAVDLAVEVREVGGTAPPDHPLAPAHLACGNRVPLPGAFSLSGPRPNRICVQLGEQTACRTVTEE